jgi:hypothetical protein
VVHVNHLEELADHEGDRLDALNLLLGAQQLTFEVLCLVLDVLLLRMDKAGDVQGVRFRTCIGLRLLDLIDDPDILAGMLPPSSSVGRKGREYFLCFPETLLPHSAHPSACSAAKKV